MNHGQGFSANLATGLLMLTASLIGTPVSTTHVSVGALFGFGLTNRQADVRVVRNILAWLVTLPCAALLSALVYWSALNMGLISTTVLSALATIRRSFFICCSQGH